MLADTLPIIMVWRKIYWVLICIRLKTKQKHKTMTEGIVVEMALESNRIKIQIWGPVVQLKLYQ